MRNLIVDDDFGMAKTLTDILFLKGFETKQVSCGLEAVGQIKDGEFDWIILDILMPDINGFDGFRVTKQEQPGTKVILMTAFASDVLVQVGLNKGAVAVISKPLDITHLMQLITS